MKEFTMKARESKNKTNPFALMSGPTTERVFASSSNAAYINQVSKYKMIKDKNGGARAKNLLNEEKTLKENLSMALINDLFGGSKKRQQKAINRDQGSKGMKGLIQQSNKPSKLTGLSRPGNACERIRRIEENIFADMDTSFNQNVTSAANPLATMVSTSRNSTRKGNHQSVSRSRSPMFGQRKQDRSTSANSRNNRSVSYEWRQCDTSRVIGMAQDEHFKKDSYKPGSVSMSDLSMCMHENKE